MRHRRALHIPFAANSAVAIALLEEALRGHIEGRELSVKALFASAGYSSIGMRYQFDKLRARGFIRLSQSKSDKRRKVVSLTEKALKVYVEILESADSNAYANFSATRVADSFE